MTTVGAGPPSDPRPIPALRTCPRIGPPSGGPPSHLAPTPAPRLRSIANMPPAKAPWRRPPRARPFVTIPTTPSAYRVFFRTRGRPRTAPSFDRPASGGRTRRGASRSWTATRARKVAARGYKLRAPATTRLATGAPRSRPTSSAVARRPKPRVGNITSTPSASCAPSTRAAPSTRRTKITSCPPRSFFAPVGLRCPRRSKRGALDEKRDRRDDVARDPRGVRARRRRAGPR